MLSEPLHDLVIFLLSIGASLRLAGFDVAIPITPVSAGFRIIVVVYEWVLTTGVGGVFVTVVGVYETIVPPEVIIVIMMVMLLVVRV